MAKTAFDHISFLKTLTQRPGVYQMLAESGDVLYVGKAKNLKNRVSSYFKGQGLSGKTQALVAKIARIDVTVTTSETEALILEQNLIKQYLPPYNILLRDDKSYPYIFLSDGDSPRIAYHRGAKKEKGTYYGPYPNASSVKESLSLLQRVFQVRQCDDSYFANRTRPCLQYQIKRCTAPCVGLVSKEEYAQQVEHTRLFLEGKNDQLLTTLADQMEKASHSLDFEKAAQYRDQIKHLQRIVESQYIEAGHAEADVIAASCQVGLACVHVLFIRGGRILGSKSFYPKLPLESNEADVLQAFVAQFYLSAGHEVPSKIMLNTDIEETTMLTEALTEKAKKQVQISTSTRGNSLRWLSLATSTAEQNLQSRVLSKASMLKRFTALQQALQLEVLPERIECFDISHSSGEATVASCVVFNQQGPVKSDYRKFNIDGITPGDDYAAMEQALTRRFKRLVDGEGKAPDILLIDGGKGQVAKAVHVLQSLGLDTIHIVGVAKGPTRKAGLETLIIAKQQQEFELPAADSPALHLIQYVRDESHRFAVKAHTARRDKKRQQSRLEDIPNVGAKRRRELLRFFGSIKAITEAPARELAKVPGISEKIADDIYAYFHQE